MPTLFPTSPGWPELQDLLVVTRVQPLKALAFPCRLFPGGQRFLLQCWSHTHGRFHGLVLYFSNGSPGTACGEQGDIGLAVGLDGLKVLFQPK